MIIHRSIAIATAITSSERSRSAESRVVEHVREVAVMNAELTASRAREIQIVGCTLQRAASDRRAKRTRTEDIKRREQATHSRASQRDHIQQCQAKESAIRNTGRAQAIRRNEITLQAAALSKPYRQLIHDRSNQPSFKTHGQKDSMETQEGQLTETSGPRDANRTMAARSSRATASRPSKQWQAGAANDSTRKTRAERNVSERTSAFSVRLKCHFRSLKSSLQLSFTPL